MVCRKLHKNNIPLKPIVSTSGSVTYKLSKYIATILKPLNCKISNSYVLNTDDFVERIRNVEIRNKIMVSFDVSSLFTNVPCEVSNCLNLFLNIIKIYGNIPISKIFEVCGNICVQSAIFC